jgi:protein-tyrosine phosphatase
MTPLNKAGWREISPENPYKVLFVCLGNICRSPTAEGTFLHHVKQAGLETCFVVDSAGLGPWHVGERPHHITLNVAEKYGVHLPSLGRMILKADLEKFDLILAMDHENYAGIVAKTMKPELRAKVRMMRDFDPEHPGADVPDPYYGTREDFENVFSICNLSSKNLLSELLPHIVKPV